MSGGGGDYTGVKPDTKIACHQLVFDAILQSPDPVVVGKLTLGDELKIVEESQDGPVKAIHDKYGEVGSIVRRISNLLDCINDGHSYVAVVKRVLGNRVDVEVRPK